MNVEKRNADGTLTVPGRGEGPGGMIGDGMITIGPDDPRYEAWDQYLSRTEEDEALQRGPGAIRTITEQSEAPATITEQMS